MKRERLLLLACVNIVLLAVALGRPASLRSDTAAGWPYNCCQKDSAGEPFCCAGCCFNPFGPECRSSKECGKLVAPT